MRKSGAIVNIAFLYIAIARVPVTEGRTETRFARVLRRFYLSAIHS